VQTGQSSRERKANMREEMMSINPRLNEIESAAKLSRQNQTRRDQVGSGTRGDKRRTYRVRKTLYMIPCAARKRVALR
jgi:protein subunit release factor A